jgi:hypothetical protein
MLHRIFIGFFILTLLSPAPQARAQVDPGERSTAGNIRFIDVHNHLFGMTGRGGPFGRTADYAGAARAAVVLMDELGTAKAIVMPPPFTEGQRDVFEAEAFLSTLSGHPGRFAFMGGGGKTEAALARRFEARVAEIAALGAVGLGELAAEHFSFTPRHPYETAPPDHPLFLLLADLAGRYNLPVDLHMEAIPRNMPLPDIDRLKGGNNPASLTANIPAFERLLSHNRNARIIWAHAGWDNTGCRTVELMDDLLARHPNLYMSIKFGDDSVEENRPLDRNGNLRPAWLNLLQKHPDRFLMGMDLFFAPPGSDIRSGPGRTKATRAFLSQLPEELARRIGADNPQHLFPLKR